MIDLQYARFSSVGVTYRVVCVSEMPRTFSPLSDIRSKSADETDARVHFNVDIVFYTVNMYISLMFNRSGCFIIKTSPVQLTVNLGFMVLNVHGSPCVN